jgi:molybdopterin-guanine dinucleotide biosynthesis protein A
LCSSAIVLAGGISSRIGEDKGMVRLAEKPLVGHVLDRINDLVDEKIVVLKSRPQAEKYKTILDRDVKFVIDKSSVNSPLVGAIAGFEKARGDYSVLLSCDAPFVSKEVLQLLLELCVNKNATIPRWPNCNIEPLQAIFRTKPSVEAANQSFSSGNLRLQGMVERLRNVRYVSTIVLQQIDPGLNTFFNVNTTLDLKKAESILKTCQVTSIKRPRSDSSRKAFKGNKEPESF